MARGRKKSIHDWVLGKYEYDPDLEMHQKTDICSRCGLERWMQKEIGLKKGTHGYVYCYLRPGYIIDAEHRYYDAGDDMPIPLCIVCIEDIVTQDSTIEAMNAAEIRM